MDGVKGGLEVAQSQGDGESQELYGDFVRGIAELMGINPINLPLMYQWVEERAKERKGD